MKFQKIKSIVGKVPFISTENAEFLYNLICREKLKRILELGIAHGTATCYMAAALDELREGLITAVDLIEPMDVYNPSAEEQLRTTGLSKYAQVVRMQTGYTWFLHDEILKNTENDHCNEIYDLCIIDGPKNWTIDGAAFFYVDKLLKKNGWIIFDDYNWTYAKADEKRKATDGITHHSLSEDERQTPHVREIFELLVKQHPNYSNLLMFKEQGWAIAQKVVNHNKNYTVVQRNEDSYKDIIVKMLYKVRQFIRKLTTA